MTTFNPDLPIAETTIRRLAEAASRAAFTDGDGRVAERLVSRWDSSNVYGGGWGQEPLADKIERVMREELKEQAEAAPAPPTLTLADALKIAKGCFDYGGGYRREPDKLEIFHHGIQTVINSLEAAMRSGLDDTQVRTLHSIGDFVEATEPKAVTTEFTAAAETESETPITVGANKPDTVDWGKAIQVKGTGLPAYHIGYMEQTLQKHIVEYQVATGGWVHDRFDEFGNGSNVTIENTPPAPPRTVELQVVGARKGEQELIAIYRNGRLLLLGADNLAIVGHYHDPNSLNYDRAYGDGVRFGKTQTLTLELPEGE